MPFIQPEPFTFFNVKLTDQGRQAASKGQLRFNKVVLSDREIDYSMARQGNYNFFNNRVMDIVDFYPDIDNENFDYSSPFEAQLVGAGNEGLGYNAPISITEFALTSEKLVITGSSSSTTLSDFVSFNKTLTYSNNSSNWGTNKVTLGGAGTPVIGQIIAIPWVSPDYISGTYDPNNMPQNDPCVLSFYKIISAVTSPNVFLLDRPIPSFGTGTDPVLTCQIFEDNIIEDFIGNTTSYDPGLWNMNIVRTNTLMGTLFNTDLTVSGYTTYGSIEFNGTKHYFGFGNNFPSFGVIHYTNKWTGNTYAEQFLEGTFEMNLPGIMWHHNLNSYYNNQTSSLFTSYNSSGTTWGLYLSDFAGDIKYDSLTRTTYKELYDARSERSISVGRVYHKLQLVIITDQELLTALTYKSNRNYTLPDFELSLTDTPQYGLYPNGANPNNFLSGYTATGLIESDYDYFVTYIAENSSYSPGTSIGNSASLPCGYIKKISSSGFTGSAKQFLKLRFPYPNSFPYMRDDTELSSPTYGTGWNANTVQILLNKQQSSLNFDVANVPYKDWVRVSDKNLGGNGVYRASDYGLNTIDPKLLNSYEFIISYEDYASGSTYTINSGLTLNQDYLNFGDECFFYGTIKTGVVSSVYKTRIKVFVDNNKLNSSSNPTFDSSINKNTFITEIAVLDPTENVVAVGKPTYPILKNNIRGLNLLLDIDF